MSVMAKILEHHMSECKDRYLAIEGAMRSLDAKVDRNQEAVERGFNKVFLMFISIAGGFIVLLLVGIATLTLKLVHP